MRLFGGRRNPWVEPGNAITRAVYSGRSLATFETWMEPDVADELEREVRRPAAEAPAATPPAATPEEAPAKGDSPKRPGVAA